MPLLQRLTAPARRAAILQAAIRLFAERGFRGTTTRALAEAVGVTEPVLYEHFPSKRDLFAAIVEAKSREGFQRGAALLEPYVRARDDRGFFVRLAEFVLQLYRDDPAYTRLLLFAALEEPRLGALFHERQREGRELLTEYIRQRIEEGAFRPLDARLAAQAFMGMLHHQGLLAVLYRDRSLQRNLKQMAEGIAEIFLHGVAAAAEAAAPECPAEEKQE